MYINHNSETGKSTFFRSSQFAVILQKSQVKSFCRNQNPIKFESMLSLIIICSHQSSSIHEKTKVQGSFHTREFSYSTSISIDFLSLVYCEVHNTASFINDWHNGRNEHIEHNRDVEHNGILGIMGMYSEKSKEDFQNPLQKRFCRNLIVQLSRHFQKNSKKFSRTLIGFGDFDVAFF